MNLEKRVSNSFNLFFNPQIQYYPKSFTQSMYGLDQQYWMSSARMGIRILVK